METAPLLPPDSRRQAPGMNIPLWLAMPAGAAAVAVVAVVAAAVIVNWAGEVGLPQDRGQIRDRSAVPAAPRVDAAAHPASASPQVQRYAELDKRFEAARLEHESGRHAEAFSALLPLADEGHCESARLALQLIQAGPRAYLTSFHAGPKQIARWRALPGCWPKAPGR